MKKILFISYGDSNNASSWSNIPYLFSQNLENKGFELERLDIFPIQKWNTLWFKYIFRYLSIVYPNQQYSYIRTYLNRVLTFNKIKKVIKKNSDAYFCVFLNFEYYNKFNQIPSLLLGDWTYDIVILDKLQRKPYFFETWFLKYQKEAIENAEVVVSLFKDSKDKISQRYNKEVNYLGMNVINDLNNFPISNEEALEKKANSKEILFIGTAKYIEGAKKLAQAFIVLKKQYPDLILNFIGFSESELDIKFTDINCFGYLRKEVKEENEIYYKLLTNAKVIVNPSDFWAGYSSTIEAMFYFTPVIVPKYSAFVDDFGEDIDFGYYLSDTQVKSIEIAIDNLFRDKHYLDLCIKANEKVKNFTWNNFVDKIIILMENVKNK